MQLGAEVWALLKHRDALLLLTSHVIGAGGRGLGVATIYIPLYLSPKLQVNEVQLGILLTIMMAGSVIGPLIAGPLSDRMGRKPVLLGDYVLACLCFAGLLAVGGSSWTLPVVLTVTGIAVYSEGALMQTALADVADKTSMEMLFGLYFTVGSAIGAPWAVPDRRPGGWLRLCRGVRGHGRCHRCWPHWCSYPCACAGRSMPSPATHNLATSLSDGWRATPWTGC